MRAALVFRSGFSAALALLAAGCAQERRAALPVMTVSYSTADRDCMARAIYFESNRSGEDGMLAVGTVVANRLQSGRYGTSVCDVVGEKGQFAAGVMTRTMEGEGAERARRVAEGVLAGKRHAGVRQAMFFHTAGRRYHYSNMHYVLVAGGNAFYEKREAETAVALRENAQSRALALAYARADPTAAAKPILVASAEPLTVASVAAPAARVTTTVAEPAVQVGPTLASLPTPSSRSIAAGPAPSLAPVVRPTPMAVAYAAEAKPAAAPRPALRVVTPSAPVLASVGPVSAPPAASFSSAPPVAASFAGGGSVVADAWAAFDAR